MDDSIAGFLYQNIYVLAFFIVFIVHTCMTMSEHILKNTENTENTMQKIESQIVKQFHIHIDAQTSQLLTKIQSQMSKGNSCCDIRKENSSLRLSVEALRKEKHRLTQNNKYYINLLHENNVDPTKWCKESHTYSSDEEDANSDNDNDEYINYVETACAYEGYMDETDNIWPQYPNIY